MEPKIKFIHSQDAGLKVSPKNSGETSLNLSTEIMEYIIEPIPEKGQNIPISFILYKGDFLKGLAYIITNLPLYKSSSTNCTKIEFSDSYFDELYSSIQEFFGNQSEAIYDVNIFRRSDSRIYLNDLRKGSFSIRNFLIEELSVLKFYKSNGRNVIRLDVVDNLLDNEKNEIVEDASHELRPSSQKIFYGAPGSGKSHKVQKLTETYNDKGIFGLSTEEREIAYQEYLDKKNEGNSNYKGGKTNIIALTHPKLMKYISESVGCEINSFFEVPSEDIFNKIVDALNGHEPYLNDSITKGSGCHWQTGINSYGEFLKEQSQNKEKRKDIVFRTTFHPDYDYASFVGCYKPSMNDGNIEYSFTPQVFTKAYIAAWENTGKPVYLVIEEINRGNCAQIFGDIFQLLDRDKDTGMSQYPIQVDKDLTEYIESRLGSGHAGIKDGKLCLPPNLIIYATMNTSDQSLFPMDSAFKRRWDWEYVPIDLHCPDSQFAITIGDKKYQWSKFLEEVNKRIHNLSDSEDKQMGNFFIKHDIGIDEFKSKVMFYLWSEVCKEYEKAGSFFKDASKNDEEFTFSSLFPDNEETRSILQGFMQYLGVEGTIVSE